MKIKMRNVGRKLCSKENQKEGKKERKKDGITPCFDFLISFLLLLIVYFLKKKVRKMH